MKVSGGITSDVLILFPHSNSNSNHYFPFYIPCNFNYGFSNVSPQPTSSFLSAASTFTPKGYSAFYSRKPAAGLNKSKSRGFTVRATGQFGENVSPIAPVHLESPAGQLLTQILQTHPHLLPAAIDQQLEILQKDREAQKAETPSSSQALLLYRRIAELREKDRQKALEEILYCLIVHKFLENNITMIPKMTPSPDITGRVDFWPNQELKLESVHSPEAFEMIQSHLSLVLGERLVGPLQPLVEISKIKLGKLYAASIMYGYFLRRVDQRYQLERSMNTLPKDFGKNMAKFQETDPLPESPFWDPDSLIQIPADEEVVSFTDPSDLADGGTYKLRSYVMYLDTETLQRYATMRSKEAMKLIERQTQAIFGRPDIKVTGGILETKNDEIVSVSFSGLTMLVLEAVAFGSFLWDAEDYVESKYSSAES